MPYNENQMSDSFLDCLHRISIQLKNELPRSYFAVMLGQWLRVSLALRLPKNAELGHPSADACWDFLGFSNFCFFDAGIEAELCVSTKQFSLARKTSVRQRSNIPEQEFTTYSSKDDFSTLLADTTFPSILTMQDGSFIQYTPAMEVNLDELFQLPLEPTIIRIKSIKRKVQFPWNTYLYWGWIFERGEEPIETLGNNKLSVISGWKAYARWMHGTKLPPHQHLFNLPILLKDRKQAALEYFKVLKENSEGSKIKEILDEFIKIISDFLQAVDMLILAYSEKRQANQVRSAIKNCYFIDQRTNLTFKKIKHYHFAKIKFIK